MVGSDWRETQCSTSVEGDGVPGIACKNRVRKALSRELEGEGARSLSGQEGGGAGRVGEAL